MEKLVKKQNKPENRLIKNRIFKNILKFSQVKAQHDHGGENFKKDFIISAELKKLTNALMSVRPTSTSSERVYSVAGHLNCKTRNRMSSETLKWVNFVKILFFKK